MIETIIWKNSFEGEHCGDFFQESPFDTKNLDYRFVEIFQGINLISTARNELAWLHKHVDTWSRSGSNRYRKFDRALSRVRSPGSLSIIQRPWLPYNPRILHLPVSIRIALCPCASIHACDSNSRCFICHPGPTPILTMTNEAWIELLEARSSSGMDWFRVRKFESWNKSYDRAFEKLKFQLHIDSSTTVYLLLLDMWMATEYVKLIRVSEKSEFAIAKFW